MLDKNLLSERLRSEFDFFGMGEFKLSTVEIMTINGLEVTVRLETSMKEGISRDMTTEIERIFHPIANSPARSATNKLIADLKGQIEYLKQFKTYYELSFKLAHPSIDFGSLRLGR